jgi:hypothetical protein
MTEHIQECLLADKEQIMAKMKAKMRTSQAKADANLKEIK